MVPVNTRLTLFKAGVPVSSGGLDPATTYDVQARVWNNSLEAPESSKKGAAPGM
jgi:hypothetical protein